VGEATTDSGTTLPTPSQPDDQRERKAPMLTLKSARGKPLNVNIEPKEFARLMSALGTGEPGFANPDALGNIINAACDGGSARPPREEDINQVLAAVSGIGARDEIEGMPRNADGGNAFRSNKRFASAEGRGDDPSAGQERQPRHQAAANVYNAGRGTPALSRQGAAESHGRARPRPFRGAGYRRCRPPGGGDQDKSEEQALAPPGITHEPGTPLWSPDAEREAVPIAGSARKAPV